ncbi:acetyl-CoA hydrolase/transferase family protein [Desulfosporosinus sp. BICA1-9]|uniref:acetyl-CoA hydrolase/transferase family protein n=1 Tax=Desulfosporosinus sp. BICA1-9 TaxID=1531958 RepID=UPI00054B433A|nr:acetyl-CoA hydrolase/transferase C-terminal domain-containing protein [Desulfosporosinus sp. BICA1-9]KJS46385.1 MAG: 4-hydroxybutyrate CoA-transferase [Peptococcaceae bacterium BRH_c23]KJS86500.1 MAG: 4-hydroxybutyrate CoA-transferase [Desulfosporosinus sp. BICA1-9]HBW35593.1 4-hydroxybutyrate CoA-transferase [Desulfosporosinus sp.]
MLSAHELYRQKLVSPEEAVKLVKSGDVIWAPPASNEPNILFDALADRKDELQGVVLRQFLSRRKRRYMDPSYAPHISIESFFVTNVVRNLIRDGFATYVPSNFGDIPSLIRKSGCDVLMLTVAPMDEHGYLNFGLGCDYTLAAMEVARNIIVEVNPNMPRTRGYNNIHISKVDLVVEYDVPMIELPVPLVTKMDETIGSYIADLIEDGSTLQVGIGGIPTAVCKFLEHKKDLGIHTELITDYLIDLVESGALNGSKKSIHKGKIVATIVEGTRKLFDYVNNNSSIELHPVDYTNNPNIIAQNHKMISINATIEVDLFGQCCSESIGTTVWGGSGGQSDFARGVTMCPDGKGFIVLKSTAKNGTISKIVPTLSPGASVTTGRNYVDHVVTEYGVVKLRGKSTRERALALISIAHPDFRDQLRHAARQFKII